MVTTVREAGDEPTTAEGAPSRIRRGVRGRLISLYLTRLTPAAVAVGVLLRTREWLHNKSLWLDELSITQYLTERDFAGLAAPLGNGQGAPVGWLWAERLSIDIFGVNDLVLRLVPWLGSLVALGVFPLVARRLIGPVAAPVATLLFATSAPLIYYAAETKQYSTDSACALVAILLTARFLTSAPTIRSGLLWGLCCSALVWCSQPSILVAAACGLFLLIRCIVQRTSVVAVIAGGLLLGAAVLADWIVALRQLGTVQILQVYWSQVGGYPVPGASLATDLTWLGSAARAFAATTAGLTWLPIALPLGLWGLAMVVRRRPWSALLITLVFLGAIGAAVTRHYPLSGRLALYLLPVSMLLLCAGLTDAAPTLTSATPEDAAGRPTEGPVGATRRRRRAVTSGITLAALCLVTSSGVASGLGKLVHPDDITSGRQAIDFVSAHQLRGDVVIADAWALEAVNFYGPPRHVTISGLLSFNADLGAPCPADPLAALGNAKRIWLLFAHHPSNQPADRVAVYASQFAARGTEIASYRGAGDAAALLFDLSRPPASPGPVLDSWVPNSCFVISR